MKRIALFVLAVTAFGLVATGCGNSSLRGRDRDRRVSSACFEAGFAPCNSLVVAVQEHRRGNLNSALTSLNLWLAQVGLEREQLASRPDLFKVIAMASPDASRLFRDAVKNPMLGERIPMMKTAVPSPAAVQGPVGTPSPDVGGGWLTVERFENSRANGSLMAVGEGLGFLMVTSPIPEARVLIGDRAYGMGHTVENVQSGYREFEVQADGFKSQRGYVLVEPLKVARIHVPLERGRGALTIVSTPGNAEVTIDGLQKGRTPLTLEDMASGVYQVQVRLGPRGWQGRVRVGTGTEVIRPTLELPPAPKPVMRAPEPRRVVQPPSRVVQPPPVQRQQVPQRRPVQPPAPVASQGGKGVDLRSLGPDLQLMAWNNLRGKSVVVTLANGASTSVVVGAVQGDSVVLTPGDGTPRKVPMRDIALVQE